MKELLILNPERASEDEVAAWRIREAARAIVTDADGNIALLHVTKEGYYKLPGGGLEGDEDKMIALARECQEEIGCDVDVTREVGMVTEWRKFCTLRQISYCYLATVKGEKGQPDFTEDEIAGGFECVWVSYDEALRLMTASLQTAGNIEGKEYITPRDIAFLQASRTI